MMQESSMTARISAFARAYHSQMNEVKIFDDVIAKELLTNEEYSRISNNMANGIQFFNPDFKGKANEALRWIVDHQLSQTPLARAAFAEKSLERMTKIGFVEQYLILAAGFDSFAYRQPEWANKLDIFEIDHPLSMKDKQERLERSNIEIPANVHYINADFATDDWINAFMNCNEFQSNKICFCSILGLIYYLSKEEFERFIELLSQIIPNKSNIVFDYPNEHYFDNQGRHSALAKASKEEMKACYSYEEMEKLLARHNLLISEHLDSDEMTDQYFKEYNQANTQFPMEAQKNVNYCLCIKYTQK